MTKNCLRIDKLEPGTQVVLKFTHDEERAVFLGIIGEGKNRYAHFLSFDPSEYVGFYSWLAYRYNGHWAYGTSAERLSLVSVFNVIDLTLTNI